MLLNFEKGIEVFKIRYVQFSVGAIKKLLSLCPGYAVRKQRRYSEINIMAEFPKVKQYSEKKNQKRENV
jgi:hypothetical protein